MNNVELYVTSFIIITLTFLALQIFRHRKHIKIYKKRAMELERFASFGKLSAGIFHDLMSPITGMNLYLETAKGGNKTIDDTKKTLDKIIKLSKTLDSYTVAIKKNISPTCTEKITFNNSSNLLDIVKSVFLLYGFDARMNNIKLSHSIDKSVNIPIPDARLYQVIMSLTSNAIESLSLSKKENKEVSIKASRKDAIIFVSVKDNGIGFDQKNIVKAFREPFTTKTGGNGIGLMTVNEIVKNELRGKISIENTPGGGVNILLEIPKIS